MKRVSNRELQSRIDAGLVFAAARFDFRNAGFGLNLLARNGWLIMATGARIKMKKSLIVLLAMVAGFAGLAIGLGAVRSGRPGVTKTVPSFAHFSSPAAGENPRAKFRPPTGTADSDRVVRFVKNPQPMPAFLVSDLDGKPVSTAAWKGKVVFLNFWATWCPPCRAEVPILIDLATRYKDRVQIVGVSLDDGPEEVKAFAKDTGMNYPVVMASRDILAEYGGIPALPTLFVINPDGNVVQKHEGLYSRELYETEIRLLLGLPADATIETFDDTGQIFLKNAALATELPGVDFAGLTPDQKKAALRRMNSDRCDCGCRFTLAQCRINDTSCPVSLRLAASVVKRLGSAGPSSQPQKPSASPE
jgi:thiol-disulfide isomerase/thioredoxin